MRKYKNKATTAIGSIIIIGSLICLYMGKMDGVQAGAIITIGAGFFLAKDHNVQ